MFSKPSTKLDPARAALADAIKTAQSARQAADAARAAVARAADIVEAAEARLATATAAIVEAKSATASRLVAAMAEGASPPPDRAVRAARAEEQDAADQLDAAREALATLEAAVGGYDREAAIADRAVKAATRDVLMPEIEPAIARLIAARRQLNIELATLTFYYDRCLAPGDPFDPRKRETLSVINAFDRVYPEAEPWRSRARELDEAFGALLKDATVRLPAG